MDNPSRLIALVLISAALTGCGSYSKPISCCKIVKGKGDIGSESLSDGKGNGCDSLPRSLDVLSYLGEESADDSSVDIAITPDG